MAKKDKLLKVGKNKNRDENGVFFAGRETFLCFKSLIHKIGKAKILRVVIGRPIVVFFCSKTRSFSSEVI